MRVHHLNCATMCPYGASLIRGGGGLFSRTRLVCHCVLVESSEGLILVDTGLGMDDISDPKRLGTTFHAVARPRLNPEETALQQIIRLGFKREDVRHVVLTHLDVDHAGGLADFPEAQIHVSEREHEAAHHRQAFIERHRYIPAQWAHEPKWQIHRLTGETWFGFESVQALSPMSTEVLLIPLYGHTRGHCGVAIRHSKGWLLHCGDAYFSHHEMAAEHPHCPLGLGLLQCFLDMDRGARLRNQDRLRQLRLQHGNEVEVFCAHDPAELPELPKPI
ncbi:MAG: MBL fold metallo-hydrolase [Candidatus Hydrogenedentes bacterium]|nr:MBL fold metallo-hydrolase [Candidatus Hydrogenedentota bacterium]